MTESGHLSHDPFATLGLPRRFDLAEADIARAHLRAIALAHPDVAGADSEQLAAELNAARDQIANPESRAESLLMLMGGPAKGDDKGLPPAFLIEVMEIRESIEADLADDAVAARAKWGAWATTRRHEHAARVAEFFAKSPPDLAGVRKELNAWRYIERLLEQLDPAYDPNRADFRT
ncbi:MAG: iron-sulfur cluster co-chaperone HscB C-terminal domain-containing protein [Phycisphaerales bacterium]|nr:MAG: hypothetical protein IPK69_01715 [Phycisphaerales bacterium]